jgi:sugar O-acyltransferase (sialic acid O-acetyltransferase NeuD family)
MGQYQHIAFLDDEFPGFRQVCQWRIVGKTQAFREYINDYRFFIAIGNNGVRAQWHHRLESAGAQIETLVHPSSVVSQHVELGAGTLVLAKAVINIQSTLGRSCIVNTAATVDHDCHLGDFVHVAPGSHCAGGVKLENQVFMGIGSAAIPGVTIGENTIVGAGATVVRSLSANVTAIGTPAKVISQDGK